MLQIKYTLNANKENISIFNRITDSLSNEKNYFSEVILD
jgi:hypothetical protein